MKHSPIDTIFRIATAQALVGPESGLLTAEIEQIIRQTAQREGIALAPAGQRHRSKLEEGFNCADTKERERHDDQSEDYSIGYH